MTPNSVPMISCLARSVGRPYFKMLYRHTSKVKITGREHLSHKGAYSISVNRLSLIESSLNMEFWLAPPESAGIVKACCHLGQGIPFRLSGAIPVHRLEFNRKVLDVPVSLLKSGRPRCLPPGGERVHEPWIRRTFPNILYSADRTAAPVIPLVAMSTPDEFLGQAPRSSRPGMMMRIGKPLMVRSLAGIVAKLRHLLQAKASRIMVTITSLMSTIIGVYINLQMGQDE